MKSRIPMPFILIGAVLVILISAVAYQLYQTAIEQKHKKASIVQVSNSAQGLMSATCVLQPQRSKDNCQAAPAALI